MINLPKVWTKSSLTRFAKELLGQTARVGAAPGDVEISFIPRGKNERVVIGRGTTFENAAEKVFLGPLMQRYERSLEKLLEKESSAATETGSDKTESQSDLEATGIELETPPG